MKSLLNGLDKETIVLTLKSSVPTDFKLAKFNCHKVDDNTIEVELHREDSLNTLFGALSEHNIEVCNMKNKANRLEELFISLVEKSEASL